MINQVKKICKEIVDNLYYAIDSEQSDQAIAKMNILYKKLSKEEQNEVNKYWDKIVRLRESKITDEEKERIRLNRWK